MTLNRVPPTSIVLLLWPSQEKINMLFADYYNTVDVFHPAKPFEYFIGSMPLLDVKTIRSSCHSMQLLTNDEAYDQTYTLQKSTTCVRR